MKLILFNNLKVVGIFIASLFILLIFMFIMYGLTETQLVSHRVYDVVIFLVSIGLLVLHFFLGKRLLSNSGNKVIDLLSFVLIIIIAAIYIQRTPSGIISNHYSVFSFHYEFLRPFFDYSIVRIGVGVLLSCIAQYLGMLSKIR